MPAERSRHGTSILRRLRLWGKAEQCSRRVFTDLLQAAFKARGHWLRVEWLPKYASELNDIEVAWGDLKAHHLVH